MSSVQRIVPHGMLINGHPTSIRLEPEYWYWLRQIAAEQGTSARKFIQSIAVAKNPHRGLASALRVTVAGYFELQAREALARVQDED